MATGTLARDTEQVVTSAEKIVAAASAEKTERVDSREESGTTRAWDAKAQVD